MVVDSARMSMVMDNRNAFGCGCIATIKYTLMVVLLARYWHNNGYAIIGTQAARRSIMIGYLHGKLRYHNEHTIIIDVQGVGYEVEVHQGVVAQLPEKEQPLQVFTYHHVREDASALFGFTSSDEKQLFQLLLKVNGVGPRLALAIIGYMPTNQLVQAILQEDLAALKPIKGLGPTVAKRLVMDLKKPLSAWVPSMPLLDAATQTPTTLPWQDAILVLTRLGYKRAQAEKVVQSHIADANDLDHLIRLALKSMAKDTVGVS